MYHQSSIPCTSQYEFEVTVGFSRTLTAASNDERTSGGTIFCSSCLSVSMAAHEELFGLRMSTSFRPFFSGFRRAGAVLKYFL